MKTWKRAKLFSRCGNCGASIRLNEVYLEYQPPGMHRALKRCGLCVEEPVPDLPVPVKPLPLPTPSAFVPLAHVARDFKQRQTGEREPGEEG